MNGRPPQVRTREADRHRHRVQATAVTQRGRADPQRMWGADGEHPEDPTHEHGKWMRTERNKRKTVEEEGEHVEEDRDLLENVGETEAKHEKEKHSSRTVEKIQIQSKSDKVGEEEMNYVCGMFSKRAKRASLVRSALANERNLKWKSPSLEKARTIDGSQECVWRSRFMNHFGHKM